MFRSIALILVLPSLAAAGLGDSIAFLESFFEQPDSQISNTDGDLISNLTKMIMGEMLPEINSTHARDVSLLKAHAKAMGDCDTTLRRTGKTVILMNASVLGEETKLNACKKSEDLLESAYQRANQSITQFLETAVPPSSTIPSLAAGPSVESYVFGALDFWTKFKKTYSGMKAALSNASDAYFVKAANCSAQRTGFKTSYCNLKLEISGAQKAYGTCRSGVEYLYNQTLLTSNSNANGRKTDYKAVLRLKCYLEVIQKDKNEAPGKLAACKTQVVDASFLDIVEPSLPAPPTAYLTNLDLPAGGPACDADNGDDDSLY